MAWTIANARQNFADLVKVSEQAPQEIERYGKPVALLIGGESLRQFHEFQKVRGGAHLAQAFADFRALSPLSCEFAEDEALDP